MRISSIISLRVCGAPIPVIAVKVAVTVAAVVAATTATATTMDPLPIEPGIYVREGSQCRDAPFAAIFTYDGHDFAGPHASDCASRVVALDGTLYQVATTCRALGDGTPAAPDTEIAWVTVQSRASVRVDRRGDSATYRRCSAT